jgi:hypothetical protein
MTSVLIHGHTFDIHAVAESAIPVRAPRVSPLLQGAVVPEAFQPKPPPSRKEARHLSMKQAPARKSCAPSPAAMAAASNPVALRYWNQCLALSNPAGVEEPLDQTAATVTPTDASFPPWATAPEERVAPREARPCPPAGPSIVRSVRPAGVTDWAAILAEEDGTRALPRAPRPWGGQWGGRHLRGAAGNSCLEAKNGSMTSQVKINSIQPTKELTQSNGSNGRHDGSLVRNHHPPPPFKAEAIRTKQPAPANGVKDEPAVVTEKCQHVAASPPWRGARVRASWLDAD